MITICLPACVVFLVFVVIILKQGYEPWILMKWKIHHPLHVTALFTKRLTPSILSCFWSCRWMPVYIYKSLELTLKLQNSHGLSLSRGWGAIPYLTRQPKSNPILLLHVEIDIWQRSWGSVLSPYMIQLANSTAWPKPTLFFSLLLQSCKMIDNSIFQYMGQDWVGHLPMSFVGDSNWPVTTQHLKTLKC